MSPEIKLNRRTILLQSHTHQFAGGGERSSMAIIRDLVAAGHKVHVIVPKKGPYQKEATLAGAKVHVVRSYWWTKNNLNEYQPRQNLLASRKIVRLIQQIKPDICITNTIVNPWLGYSAYITGTTHAWIIREFGDTDHGLEFWAPKEKLCQMVDELSEKVFTSSESLRRHFQPLIPNNKIDLVLPSVTAPEALPSPNPFTAGVIKLVCVGSLSPGKGQMDAIMAVEQLISAGHATQLLLLGPTADQKYSDELTKYVSAHNLEDNVKFVGPVDNPSDYVQHTDISLVCSRTEAFGRVTIESMLLAKPVIGTDTAGTKDILGEFDNGSLLYSPGNIDQLSNKILTLHKDRRRLKAIGTKLKAMAKTKYDPGKSHQALLNFITSTKDTKSPHNSYLPLEEILSSQKQLSSKQKLRSKISYTKKRLNIFSKSS